MQKKNERKIESIPFPKKGVLGITENRTFTAIPTKIYIPVYQ